VDPASIPSTAAIKGHPVHPILVPFPIAFLVGAFASDLAFLGSDDPFWARASAWLIGVGVVMGALAAVAGLTDFLGSNRVRSITSAWVHFLGNALAMLLAIWNLVLPLAKGAARRCPQGASCSLWSS
jgi:uncharacterized membrane protein